MIQFFVCASLNFNVNSLYYVFISYRIHCSDWYYTPFKFIHFYCLKDKTTINQLFVKIRVICDTNILDVETITTDLPKRWSIFCSHTFLALRWKVASWTYSLVCIWFYGKCYKMWTNKDFHITHNSSSQIAKIFSKDKNGPIFGNGQDRKKIHKYLFRFFSSFQSAYHFHFVFIDLLQL